MKRINIFFAFLTVVLFTLVFMGCTKQATKDCDDYWIQKKEKEWGANCFFNVLVKGAYQSKIVYYESNNCLGCSTRPPDFGLTCEGDTVHFEQFSDVKLIKFLAFCNPPEWFRK